MDEPLPMRIQAWLAAALLLNLAAAIAGFVISQYANFMVPNLVRLALLLANVGCLVVYVVKWRRWRAAQRTSTESNSQ